jgi:hypothetical protein
MLILSILKSHFKKTNPSKTNLSMNSQGRMKRIYLSLGIPHRNSLHLHTLS